MCVSQINKIIDRSLASMVCEGGISALSYASIINNAVQEILVTGIITVLFSNCAAWVAKGEYDQVKAKLSNVLNVLIMVLLPATFGVIILSKPIVTLMLARGEFDSASIAMTSGALCFYTSGLLFLAVRDTLVKVFYAYKNTRTTTVVSIIAICVNIVFNFLLHSLIGLNGLALATAISAVFNAITLYILLRKQIGDFGLRVSIRTVAKSLLACVIMTALVLVVKSQIMDWPVLLGLLLCVCVGIVSYFFIALLLRIDPLILILKKMKRSPNKKI
jgi:putative peptidoglycan lipid II flippase